MGRVQRAERVELGLSEVGGCGGDRHRDRFGGHRQHFQQPARLVGEAPDAGREHVVELDRLVRLQLRGFAQLRCLERIADQLAKKERAAPGLCGDRVGAGGEIRTGVPDERVDELPALGGAHLADLDGSHLAGSFSDLVLLHQGLQRRARLGFVGSIADDQ